MKKELLILLFLVFIIDANSQQCIHPGGCTNFIKPYPTVGAPYTAPTSWQVFINPATGNAALINGGNYTLFNVTQGNTYEWTYCEAYGGVSTSWDAQLTLFNENDLSNAICFSTDVCGANGLAPYISWTATFTGVVRLLTTAYVNGIGGCQSNSSTFNKLAYRQIVNGGTCTTPGAPTNVTATPNGQNSANLSWSQGSPAGSQNLTYYWVVGTSPTVTYDAGIDQGSTAGTTATTSSLTCGTTYYFRVFAKTSCDGSSSNYTTSSSFKTLTCGSLPVNGIDIHNNTISSWASVANPGGIKFAYIKATESTYKPYSNLHVNAQLAIAQNVTVGAYHFATPLFSPAYYQAGYDHQNTVTNEVTNFLQASFISYNYIGNGFLPPALDVEKQVVSWESDGVTPHAWGDPLTIMGASALAQWIHDWTTQVFNQTGIVPVLYCNKTYATALYPYYQTGLIISKLWIADWYVTAGSPNTSGFQNWPWIFHQYSDMGVVPGISNAVDVDIFNGNMNAFNALINGGSSSCTDAFETNNNYISATKVFADPLGSGISDYTLNANIGYAGDVDWYQITTDACGTLTLSLSNLPYNYDIELYGPNGSNSAALKGSYNTGTGNESISYNVSSASPTTYYVKIYPVNSSEYTTNSCYSLRSQWTSSSCPVSCIDAFESNNNYLTATKIFADPLGEGISDYTLNANMGYAGDVDWYQITTNICGGLTITLSNLPYNYDIELYGPNGPNSAAFAGSYNTGTGNESISYNSTSATTYYIKVYAFNSSEYTTNSCYGLRSQWRSCSVLANNLISFIAQKNNASILLKWEVSNESNVEKYDIERSHDGIHFDNIGSIKGKNSTLQAQHSFIDNSPLNGKNYYRVKIISNDGKISFSNIRMVESSMPFTVDVIPNPIQNNIVTLIMRSSQNIKAKIIISNAEGKMFLTKNVNVTQGSTTEHLKIDNLSDGIYYLKLITEGNIVVEKFIKAN